MEESATLKTSADDSLGYRCAKCKFMVAVESDTISVLDYCANPETQKVGLSILNLLWKQVRELHEHNILTDTAYKGIERRIKSDIEHIQDYGVPLNTPYGQKCFVAKEASE